MSFNRMRYLFLLIFCVVAFAPTTLVANTKQNIQDVDALSAVWSYYRHAFITDGRVRALDENGITTSEGQGYALLRAVWSGDAETFQSVWSWTQRNLQVRDDRLFAWKWNGRVVDRNAATDADTDIALALVLASRRFKNSQYEKFAREIIRDIWQYEILSFERNGKSLSLPTGGNWALQEKTPTIHVGYLAPYAYLVFADIDPAHPWKNVADSVYDLLHWIFIDQQMKLPPQKVFIDKSTGHILLTSPTGNRDATNFSYDVFPIYWRIALDKRWFGRTHAELENAMLAFFESEWDTKQRFAEAYQTSGLALSPIEAPTLYTTVHSLAFTMKQDWAESLYDKKIKPLLRHAGQNPPIPYYVSNWIWFDRALQLDVLKTYEEFFDFLRPFDFASFYENFPITLVLALILLFPFARKSNAARIIFFSIGIYLGLRYLHWRFFETLNFLEPSGPFISILLWLAECYCFLTVLLLILQIGVKTPPRLGDTSAPNAPPDFLPSVDILIPIYSEPLAILEKTIVAALNMDYPNKTVYVCDDSHQESVKTLAERLGARYIRGPKKHAKAGNMNNALTQIKGELVLIFDTDHIPVRSFLRETVPYFVDPKMGFVQTPHHFYNADIFQKALLASNKIPNEQDMFNHAIQSARNTWGGSFFVGSGAIFRRTAIDEIGGFNTLSITEDIHTSQHLHARGWKSAFVDKDLAAGLTAENFASYIVQRRRWMLGCLQIFFKDNPLFVKGLPIRHRIGYFASLLYFFFPAARVVFFLAPLSFLLFHWHPIFSEVSVLVAYLLPFLIVLPLMSNALLPRWPRLFWGGLYENAVAFPLARSMFDLLLPKNLGFKVTPKGITTTKMSFDWSSTRFTLIAVAVSFVAIGKGLWESWYFGIERDAYFFNLIWASVNLFFLVIALVIAIERPQRRDEERLSVQTPVVLHGSAHSITGTSHAISLNGISIGLDSAAPIDAASIRTIEILEANAAPWDVEFIQNREPQGGNERLLVYRFVFPSEEKRHSLLQFLYGDPQRWSQAHHAHSQSNVRMAYEFIRVLFNAFRFAK